jgi:hypothetical protein
MRRSIRRGFPWFACWLALTALPLWACSVPVFRYALERWQSDSYEVVVFHKGPLSAEDQSLVDMLSPAGLAGKKSANAELRLVDVGGDLDDETKALWDAEQSKTLPSMTLRYPVPLPNPWSGPLTRANVELILDSPKRAEVARRILKGETAVWLFLESGNEQADRKALSVLETELPIAQLKLKLPEIDEQDISDGLVSIEPDELRIAFSIVRVSRDDLAEKLFVEMLLGSEGEGADGLRDASLANQPMAFPIFGRGRVLYALVGAGIDDENITSACKELIGPCTCQVKDQNPGIDMLMSVDWDGLVETSVENDKTPPPLTGIGGFVKNDGPEDPKEAESTAPDRVAVSSSPKPAAASNEPGPNSPTTAADDSVSDEPTTSEPTSAAEVTASRPESPQSTSVDAGLVRNTFLLIAVCAVGIVVASFFFVGKQS